MSGEGGENVYLVSSQQRLLRKNCKNCLKHPKALLRPKLIQAFPPASTFQGLLRFSISWDCQGVSTVPAVTPGRASLLMSREGVWSGAADGKGGAAVQSLSRATLGQATSLVGLSHYC